MSAVEDAFGCEIDFAMLQKIYGNVSDSPETRYSPAICMLALHYMYYNFCRIHQTLRVTPAREAGISDHVWNLDEVIALLD